MEVVNSGIVFKAECHYEKEEVAGKKQDVYKGFSNEGVVFVSNVEGLKKGDKVMVNPWGGSEINSLATKKNKFLVIEKRDILVKL
jgi:co-chaperonin GroES (HSP10)